VISTVRIFKNDAKAANNFSPHIELHQSIPFFLAIYPARTLQKEQH
jgi:hypothetical protein